jgi:hypothetical protein
MTLIEGVARLKELAGRRLAIERAKDTPNHAVLERIEIERELLDTAPVLLEVVGAFQENDAEVLDFLIRIYEGEHSRISTECVSVLHRLAEAARKMEAKQE